MGLFTFRQPALTPQDRAYYDTVDLTTQVLEAIEKAGDILARLEQQLQDDAAATSSLSARRIERVRLTKTVTKLVNGLENFLDSLDPGDDEE